MIKPISLYRGYNDVWWALIKLTDREGTTIARAFSLKTRDEAEARRIWDDYCAAIVRAAGRLN